MKNGKRAVVTGGAGFIGSHVVDALIADGYDVFVVDNMLAGKRERVNPRATLLEEDVRDTARLEEIFQEGDSIFHLAAHPSVPYSILHPEETNDINVGGTLSVLLAARKVGARRIVYSASSAVYGNNEVLPLHEGLLAEPVNPYGIQKYTGEHYLRVHSMLHGLETVSLRYFNVYGPRMNLEGPYAAVIGAFIRHRKQGLPLPVIGDGGQTRDFVYVEDVARANLLAMQSPLVGKGESINIGTGKGISIQQLAEIIGGDIEYKDAIDEIRHSRADNTKAKQLLKWEPSVDFDDGMRTVLAEWGLL